jgi:hypothetical protein
MGDNFLSITEKCDWRERERERERERKDIKSVLNK